LGFGKLGNLFSGVGGDNFCVPLTIDHKPGNQIESSRIISAGGSISNTGPVVRVDGTLAVSRGFGVLR